MMARAWIAIPDFPFRLAFPGGPGKILARRSLAACAVFESGVIFTSVASSRILLDDRHAREDRLLKTVTKAGKAVGCEAFHCAYSRRGRQSPRMEANQIMKRLLVLSMLSLATAGCVQSKGALSRGASYPPSPVSLAPVPSIYDTINHGRWRRGDREVCRQEC